MIFSLPLQSRSSHFTATIMNIYLKMPKYLAQWCLHDFGDEQGVVHFPRGSAEHDVLELSLSTLPKGAEPQLRQPDEIAIELPVFKTKPLPFYCYLNDHGRRLLLHIISVRFRVLLWDDLYNIERLQLPITDVIYDWMSRHGIDDDESNWETIRQIFFRMRKKYRKSNNINKS